MPLPWSDEYRLNIKIIDAQHKNFLSALSDLIDALNTLPHSKEQIEKVFSKLDSYVNYHFTTEEKYFKEFNYDGAPQHIVEHNKFKQKITEIRQKYFEDNLSAPFELVDYLENWLLDHVERMDKKYVTCFHEHGLY